MLLLQLATINSVRVCKDRAYINININIFLTLSDNIIRTVHFHRAQESARTDVFRPGSVYVTPQATTAHRFIVPTQAAFPDPALRRRVLMTTPFAADSHICFGRWVSQSCSLKTTTKNGAGSLIPGVPGTSVCFHVGMTKRAKHKTTGNPSP